MLKRAIDIILSVFGMLLFLLPAIAFALAIWLEDRGPVFFVQQRVGLNGRHFNFLKFRSMKDVSENQPGRQWASLNDIRITRTGRWLRKTAMDELPQLIKILRGDMSIVGPRPERPQAVAHLTEMISGYAERHTVRPGLTGLAQVYARYNTSDAKKHRFDVLYAKKHNVILDLTLIARSVRISLLGRWDSTAKHR